uniref:Fatty acid binding protein 10b, liver basic n=1 Tax=Myripristis murdjan TaxID=586833 RepID=A0A667WSB9_9TELE
MDFNGTWQVYSEDNLEEFLKIYSLLMMLKMRKDVKPVIVIERKGDDITFTIKTPLCTKVNSFTIGKESEFTALDGRKLKCTVTEEDGKLVTKTEKFTSVREIQGEDMVEVRHIYFLFSKLLCNTLGLNHILLSYHQSRYEHV